MIRRQREEGIALLATLTGLTVAGVLAASLVFVVTQATQTVAVARDQTQALWNARAGIAYAYESIRTYVQEANAKKLSAGALEQYAQDVQVPPLADAPFDVQWQTVQQTHGMRVKLYVTGFSGHAQSRLQSDVDVVEQTGAGIAACTVCGVHGIQLQGAVLLAGTVATDGIIVVATDAQGEPIARVDRRGDTIVSDALWWPIWNQHGEKHDERRREPDGKTAEVVAQGPEFAAGTVVRAAGLVASDGRHEVPLSGSYPSISPAATLPPAGSVVLTRWLAAYRDALKSGIRLFGVLHPYTLQGVYRGTTLVFGTAIIPKAGITLDGPLVVLGRLVEQGPIRTDQSTVSIYVNDPLTREAVHLQDISTFAGLSDPRLDLFVIGNIRMDISPERHQNDSSSLHAYVISSQTLTASAVGTELTIYGGLYANSLILNGSSSLTQDGRHDRRGDMQGNVLSVLPDGETSWSPDALGTVANGSETATLQVSLPTQPVTN